MTRTRVVVTGLGVVAASGTHLDRFWRWLAEPVEGPTRGRVDDFDPSPWLTVKERRRTDPFTWYAVAAAGHALAHAGLVEPSPLRSGVVVSTVYGALESVLAADEALASKGADAVSPFLGALACENAGASMIAIKHGLRGPAKAVVGACAGGTYAIGDATDLVRAGRADVMVAGASQGRMTPSMLAAYQNLRVLSPLDHARPFDRHRDGFVFAEGAAMLVLESLDHATARGATILAEVLGSANTNDAASMVSPSGTGAVECIEAALCDAGLAPSDITHVNAHGTGTLLNDVREAEALATVFGDAVPPVTSIKGTVGHVAGASGAFEALAAILTIGRGQIPPTALTFEPDPEVALDVVSNRPRPWEAAPILSNSFGLGGHNGCLVIGPFNASSRKSC